MPLLLSLYCFSHNVSLLGPREESPLACKCVELVMRGVDGRDGGLMSTDG